MAKLKCDDHERRVMILPSGSTVHREDGSRCESETGSIGPRSLALDMDTLQGRETPRKRSRGRRGGRRAAERLLKDIFEGGEPE
jgi:hypothetical protein